MVYVLRILFFSAIILLITGFVVKATTPQTGHFMIGLSMVMIFFVWMPIFLFVRWKDKDTKKYLLNKENIEKMQNYEKEQNKRRRNNS